MVFNKKEVGTNESMFLLNVGAYSLIQGLVRLCPLPLAEVGIIAQSKPVIQAFCKVVGLDLGDTVVKLIDHLTGRGLTFVLGSLILLKICKHGMCPLRCRALGWVRNVVGSGKFCHGLDVWVDCAQPKSLPQYVILPDEGDFPHGKEGFCHEGPVHGR